MTTDQLTGRALDEAAARAMGWRFEMGAWYRGDDSFAGNYLSGGVIPGCLTEREMLAWLHGRGEHGAQVSVLTDSKWCECELTLGVLTQAGTLLFMGPSEAIGTGTDLREALERLVVAVAAREAKV